MAPREGFGPARVRAAFVLLLLAGSSLAGCLSSPSTQLTARRGDLAELELVVADREQVVWPGFLSGASTLEACGATLESLDSKGCPPAAAPYVLAPDRPARLPDRFQNASTLPEPLVRVVSGLEEGEHRYREDVQAWGPHRSSLVETHDRRQRLPRIVEDPQAYGRVWNGSRLVNGTFEIQPDDGDRGRLLEVSEWCNERFCLFESELVNWTRTHLIVEHRARQGQQVHVRSLDTFLTVVQANQTAFTLDGNDPRAGQTYDVLVKVLDLRGPPQGERRAPSFALTTVDGDRITLEQMLGRPVVIEFFATWCPSCRENADHLAKVEDRFGPRVNIVSIGVDPWESSKALRSFMQAHDVTWPVALDEDGDVSRAYSVGTLSTEVVVGPNGAIRHVETGVADHQRIVDLLSSMIDDGSRREGPR